MGSLQIPNIVKLVRREHSRKTRIRERERSMGTERIAGQREGYLERYMITNPAQDRQRRGHHSVGRVLSSAEEISALAPYLAHLFRTSESGYAAAGISQRIDRLERPRSNNLERLRPTKNPAPPLSDLASM